VELELGTLQAVDAELLTEAFKAAALGTPAEGAELRLHPVPALADCLVCGESYAPSFGDYHCPACGRAEPRILRGQDLILTAVTGILSEEHYV
jgi:hydrogenase nickel incorporation protein HypA/HybF